MDEFEEVHLLVNVIINQKIMIYIYIGTSRGSSCRRERERSSDSGRSKKARGGTVGDRAKEAFNNMETCNDVGGTQ